MHLPRLQPGAFALASLVILFAGCSAPTPKEETSGTRIEEAGFVPIGGIEQWITIRGNDRTKPILLIVHGGPGDPQSLLVETYAPYERDFVLVQWDQRGSGRTHIRTRDAAKELSLPQMVRDGVEVAEYATKHLGQRRLIVLGHSWGSTLALEMIKQKPALFGAYVGTGQVSSWKVSVNEQWNVLQRKARAAQDRSTLDQIQKIGTPDPLNVPQYFSWRNVLNRKYLGASDSAWLEKLRTMSAAQLGVSEADAKLLAEGAGFSGRALIGAMMSMDLFHSMPRVPVPFFLIQGSEDLYTPTGPAIRYFEAVEAPVKKMTILEQAGHFAIVTHPEEFRRALLEVLSRVNR